MSRTTGRTELSVPWSSALAWRAGRQLLAPVGAEDVADVVRRLGAVPSMDERLAELAVRTRRRDSEPGELARALVEGTVVKAFAFRGAVHYLSARDGGAYLALRAAGRQWELPSWVEHYRLTAEDWPAFRAAVREALDDGPLTLAELGEAVTAHRAYRHLAGVFADGAGTLLKPLSWQGDLGFGPPREGTTTFQRLDAGPHWAGVPDLDEAGPHAVAAYLRGYGPATFDHVVSWLGKGLSAGRRRLRRWWADLEDRLVAVDVDGTTAHVLREDAEEMAAAEPDGSVLLLPGHDAWVMGPGTDDEHVTPPPLRDLVTRKANLVVHDGVVAGTWTHRRGRLDLTWSAGRPAPTTELEAAADRLAGLLGGADEVRLVATRKEP